MSLCADKLTEIMSSDHLNVPKEETVFEAGRCLAGEESLTQTELREGLL